MAYTQQTWSDGEAGGTPLSAERLNYMESGVKGAHDLAATPDPTKLDKINAVVAITAPMSQTIASYTITDDGTAATSWPNRMEVFFAAAGSAARHTFYLNEYGEIRVSPGKANTVPFRVFTRETPQDPAHSTAVNCLELMDDRTNRNILWSVDTLGNMRAANLPNRITVASAAPASPAAGDVWIDTSA